MALILQRLANVYDVLFEDWADPRVKDYFLMSSPMPIICLLLVYLYVVLHLGPQLMKNRAPFDLERIMVVYNLVQIVMCVYLVIQALRYTVFRYSLTCEPIDYSDEEVAVIVVRHAWIYFILKIVDLLDTVFFVLRKKVNHTSFLHVYHHGGMCAIGWIGTKYFGGGHTAFLGLLNCIVHIVMYSYYLLSAWDKEYKKNVWWKKHITQMQILQFGILTIYFGQTLFQPSCQYPKYVAWFIVPQNVFMIFLFSNFYINTYMKPQKVQKVEKSHSSSNGSQSLSNHESKSK